MNSEIDLVTLLALIAAVVAVVMLRSVLGRRTPDDEARIDQQRRDAAEMRESRTSSDPSDKVIQLPRRDRTPDVPAPVQPPKAALEEVEERIDTIARGNSAVANGLKAILKRDNEFDPEHFLAGARHAYELIVVGFAEGNKNALRDLTSPAVMESFGAAIDERQARGEIIDQSFVGINKSDIIAAEVTSAGAANVTLKFVSQVITATRDRQGNKIDGDDQKVRELVDIWTFERDVSSEKALQEPNWRLVQTAA